MISEDQSALRPPQRAQAGSDTSSNGTGLSAGELAELTKDASVVYMVYAGCEYEGSSPVMGFERKGDAETFCALCIAHHEARPRCPEYVPGEADTPEWDAWMIANEAWGEAHPAGILGKYSHLFTVGSLDVLPAQQWAAFMRVVALRGKP